LSMAEPTGVFMTSRATSFTPSRKNLRRSIRWPSACLWTLSRIVSGDLTLRSEFVYNAR
jgi:hypothetical protein